MSLSPYVQRDLERKFKSPLVSVDRVGGGSIATSYKVGFKNSLEIFIKTKTTSKMFEAEYLGLEEIKKSNTLRVPRVLGQTSHYLALEWIEPGPPTPLFWNEFGEAFAKMHRTSRNFFGWTKDNFIGSSPQINTPPSSADHTSAWAEFYLEKRLQMQIEMAVGYAKDLVPLYTKARINMHRLLTTTREPPALLHGDLWSGNFLCDQKAKPVLIDPAVYYGHREADLAMTTLFGGFHPDFYTAYQQEYPLQEGWKEREGLYQLYHVLNHLNLFGSSYLQQSVKILESYRG